jgi:pimeloyl-ACP methyl ester carboxylesterase
MLERRDLLIGSGAAILGAVLGLGGILRVWSPGEPAGLVDDAGLPIAGSISERVFVDINGFRQGMFIQTTNITHPVLLFVHGGPGMPEFFLNTTRPAGLERDFTIVWWEQRGAGLSYSPDISPQSMTVTQLIADTIAVTDYLRQRFGQEKIYLLGHSWGSFIGIQVAAAAPERFHAYIGMGQVTYQLRSEVEAHRYMLEQYSKRGDTAMVDQLLAAPASMSNGLSAAYLRLRDKAMHRLGVGTTRTMNSVISGIFIPIWRCPAYTLREKINIWRGKSFSGGLLWNEFINTDLSAKIHQLDLPVYFFSGLYDYTANQDHARAFFKQITAPVKGLYTFQNAAHSPVFEEPQHARDILLQDVLQGTNRLADGQQPD